MNLHKIKHDTNGNPRYCVHFLDLLSFDEKYNKGLSIDEKYDLALSKSRKLGGRKYHNKSFGGGIAFQSYDAQELAKDLTELI